jgi:hypothetical protein
LAVGSHDAAEHVALPHAVRGAASVCVRHKDGRIDDFHRKLAAPNTDAAELLLHLAKPAAKPVE